MNTIEGNQLIADFMGHTQRHLADAIVVNGELFDVENTRYHLSWDWLIPVYGNLKYKFIDLGVDMFLDYESLVHAFEDEIMRNDVAEAHTYIVELVKIHNNEKAKVQS